MKLIPLAKLHARHAQEEYDLARAALIQADWNLRAMAELLEVPRSTIQRLMMRHPKLETERDRKNPYGTERRHGGRAAE